MNQVCFTVVAFGVSGSHYSLYNLLSLFTFIRRYGYILHHILRVLWRLLFFIYSCKKNPSSVSKFFLEGFKEIHSELWLPCLYLVWISVYGNFTSKEIVEFEFEFWHGRIFSITCLEKYTQTGNRIYTKAEIAIVSK